MFISSENASQAFDLSNTHMLITGAAGGIGAATARLCSQLGASLVLTDLEKNKSTLEQLAHSLNGSVTVEGCEVEFMRVMQVNVLGPINLVRAIMPGMMERKHGRIALCGSIAGWTGGLRAGPHYSASKGGVHALVRWFAQRAAPHHVTVNGVAPGPIETGMTNGHGYDANAYPMKRMGQPEEIAGMLTYLCSPAAGFVSGAIMDVNGGTLMR